jgi:hypothetical protein
MNPRGGTALIKAGKEGFEGNVNLEKWFLLLGAIDQFRMFLDQLVALR